MIKLNIGCGKNWRLYKGYEGLDIIDYGQEHVCDVFELFRIGSIEETYDEVMANHFLEHFGQDELKKLFWMVYCILKKGGVFKFVVPHMDKERAWVLSHKTYWNETACRWLGEREARDTYGFGSWKVEEVVTNERKDIHAKLVKA